MVCPEARCGTGNKLGRLSVFSPPGKEDEGTAADTLGHLENWQITKSYCRKKCISSSPGHFKTNGFDAN